MSRIGFALVVLATVLYLGEGVKFDDDNRRNLLERHNEYRNEITKIQFRNGKVDQPPKMMKKMLWSQFLADNSQKVADGCNNTHMKLNDDSLFVAMFDARSGWIGQNLASLDDQDDVAMGVKLWVEEEALHYTFDKKARKRCFPEESSRIDDCLHMTQVLWTDTEFVGCGYQEDCTKESNGKKFAYLVCQYAKGGNSDSRKLPFESNVNRQCPHGYEPDCTFKNLCRRSGSCTAKQDNCKDTKDLNVCTRRALSSPPNKKGEPPAACMGGNKGNSVRPNRGMLEDCALTCGFCEKQGRFSCKGEMKKSRCKKLLKKKANKCNDANFRLVKCPHACPGACNQVNKRHRKNVDFWNDRFGGVLKGASVSEAEFRQLKEHNGGITIGSECNGCSG